MITDIAPIVNERVTLEQRTARVAQWLQPLDLLSKMLEGAERSSVDSVGRFLLDKAKVTAPIASPDGEQWGLSWPDGPDPESVGVLALFQSDAALHRMFSGQMDRITYYEQCQTIFLPPRRITSVWRGILSYHEATHAHNHLNGTYSDRDNGHWEEERDVFRAEHAILRQLYGFEYDDLTRTLAAKYISDLDAGTFDASPESPMFVHRRIDSIMGPPYSNMERGLRFGAVNLDAIYRALDALGRTDQPEVTRRIYEGQTA